MRLILTWGARPDDLCSEVQFYDASGTSVCHVDFTNLNCSDYASLDVDDVTVIFEI